MTYKPYSRLACDRRMFLKEAALALAVLSWPAVSLKVCKGTLLIS